MMPSSCRYEGIQEAGDLMFIPAGCPHAVRNLADIHGISMNYVDPSNYYEFLKSDLDNRKWREFELFTNGGLRMGLNADQQHITYGEFKSGSWLL
jgi:hypothetical protein